MMLKKEDIFLNQELISKEEVLNFIVDKAFEKGITDNKEGLLRDLWSREKEYSTGIQDGFAIPHSKSSHVKEASIFYIKTINSIEWGTLDGSDVKYIFNLLAPAENESNIHLQMLSKIATCLMDEDFIEEVKNSNDESQLVEYILKKTKEE